MELEGTLSNRDGIGARLTLSTPDGITQIRELTSGPTHGGGDFKAAFFGLGANNSADLEIRWPSGTIQDLGTVAVSQGLQVVEGQ